MTMSQVLGVTIKQMVTLEKVMKMAMMVIITMSLKHWGEREKI